MNQMLHVTYSVLHDSTRVVNIVVASFAIVPTPDPFNRTDCSCV